MSQVRQSRFRTALLSVTATVVGAGALIGIPIMKALAAGQERKVEPLRTIVPVPARPNLAYPAYVNPTAQKLIAIADAAMSDSAVRERILSQPDAVASEYQLSDHERKVLAHMTREQFATAEADAARVGAMRLAHPGTRQLPASATDPRAIAARMVVGRAILGAVGRSYLEAAHAHACCPWSKSIELGVNPSRVFYDEVFKAPAGLERVRPPAIDVPKTLERG